MKFNFIKLNFITNNKMEKEFIILLISLFVITYLFLQTSNPCNVDEKTEDYKYSYTYDTLSDNPEN
jgi:hypothetical protein